MDRAFTVSGRFFRRRAFALAISVWIICSLGLVLLDETSSNSMAPGLVAKSFIPEYQINVLTERRGSNLVVYGQLFNQYGVGQSGWNVTMAVSASPIPTYPYARQSGVTNSTGLVSFTLDKINSSFYSTEESVFYPNGTFAFNSTSTINLLPSGEGGLPYQSTVSVTPVLSANNHSTYALHIWRIQDRPPINVTVGYAINPALWMAYSSSGEPKSTSILCNMSLSYEDTIPTQLSVYGQPYFYSINVKNSSGNFLGGSVFWAVVTPSLQSDHFYNEFVGISSIFIAIMGSSLVFVLLVSGSAGKDRLSQLINDRKLKINTGPKSVIFRQILEATAIISIPFIAATVIIPYFMVYQLFHAEVPVYYPFIYLLSSIMILVLTVSLSLLYLFSGSPPRFTRYFQHSEPTLKWALKYVAMFIPLWYSITLNMDGILPNLPSSGIGSAVLLNIFSNAVNPIGYTWNLGEYLTRNLFLDQYFSIDPSRFFLNAYLLAVLAAVWLFVLVVLPLLYLSRKERHGSMETEG